VKNLKSYTQLISEATLNSSKADVIYTLSRKGREKISELGRITENLILQPVSEEPDEDDTIIHIRPSSFRTIEYSEFKKVYDITNPNEELFVYETSSVIYPYAIAIKDTKTTMIKQAFREGASARGDYFRETAFVITLAIRLWQRLRVQVEVASNRGRIPMLYEPDGNAYPDPPRAEFRNQYWSFMEQPKIGESMIKQVDSLIDRFGESAKRIKFIKKNSADLSINKFLKIALEEEREKIYKNSSSYDFLPEKITLSKWNPSDMWIGFEGFGWMLSDRVERVKERFKKLKIFGLPELNEFLESSIVHKNGIVGVSLKQQLIEPGRVFDINIDRKRRFVHDYKSYTAKSTTKSVKLSFTFNYDDLGILISKQNPGGEGEIDVRTFSDDKKAPISMEVRGSKKSGHMSGKAGSYIKFIMPKEDYNILEYIQKELDVDNIKKFMDENYKFTKEDLKLLFYTDLESPKSNSSNSRMQAIYFTDWLESLEDETLKDEIVSDIVRFAKSESNWSAPHLLVK
jgi:hypothetical protein